MELTCHGRLGAHRRPLRGRCGVGAVLAPDPDGDRRGDRCGQRDPRSHQEPAGDAGREGIVVDRRLHLGAGRGLAGSGSRRELAAGAAGHHRPGHGAERGQPDRSADLLADVEQAGCQAGILGAYTLQRDQ
jgi:hypothetical protein